MKIRRLFLLLSLALVVSWTANAQSLWEYTLTVGTETYTSIADEALLLTDVNGDGGTQTVTLPFEFKFGETTYAQGTQVTVRADGYLYFSGSYTNHHIRDAWTRNDCKVIVPLLAEDGNITANGATSGAYCTTDDPDNPTMLIVEFKGLKRYSNYGDYNFQVRLHSNGNISTVYGGNTLYLSSDTYHNFFLANGSDKVCLTGSYAEPMVGVPSALPNFTEAPAVGQVITYVRPVITCPKPTDLEAIIVPGDGSKTNLSWTEDGSAENWIVEYSTTDDFANAQTYNGSFTVDGSTISCQLTGLTPEQTYYVHVKADCGGGDQSNWCLPVSFTPSDAFFVNNGTSSTTNVAPLNGNYKSSYDQMIYTAAQLESAGINGPCTITKIGFNSSSANTIKRLPTLYMGTTDKNEFESSTDFISINDLTEVYSREYSDNQTDPDLWTITAGWNEFELDIPFEYDGTSNLVIAMHCALANNYSYSFFYYVSTSNYQVVYACQDYYNPDPIQFEGNWSDYSGNKYRTRDLPALRMFAEPLTCPQPTGLAIVANSLTSNGVSFTWDYEEDQTFQYALVEGTLTAIEESAYTGTWNAGNDFPTWNTLSPDTDWSFFLRKNCGDDGFSYPVFVNFHTPATCPTPSDFVMGEVTNNSAAFSWNGSTATEWKVWVKESTQTEYPTNYTLVQTTASAIVYNLNESTEYDVLIAPTCDETKTLEVLSAFTTDCNAITITNDNPFKEGFEDWTTETYYYSATNGVYPDCWKSYSEGTVYPHITNSGQYCYIHSGSNTMYFKGELNNLGGSTNSYLALPRFTNDLSTLLVTFWMETEGTPGTLSLGYITTGDVNYNTWHEIAAYDNYWSGMIQRVTYLGNLAEPIPSNATRLVFRWNYTGPTWHGACIDDVQVLPNAKVFYGGHANNGDFATEEELSEATDWHNAYNWEPNGVPTSNNNVFIAPEATPNIDNMWCSITDGNIGYANEIITDGENSLFIDDGGQLIHNGEGTFANVQQWMYYYDAENYAHDWYLIGLPFAENVSAFSQGNLLPFYNSTTGQWTAVDLYKFDQAASDGLEWINFENGATFPEGGGTATYPNAFQLKPGNEEGYLYACGNNPGGHQKATFSGVLRKSDEPATANLTYTEGVRLAGWNLIGNPFACKATVSDGDYYRLNATATEIEANTDNELNVLEGIFVKATESGQTVTFTRIDNSTGTGTNTDFGNLNLNVIREGNRIDLARVRFGEGRGLEKFQLNPNHTKVYFVMNDKDMAVVYPEGQVGELPVSFKAEKNGSYTFSFSNENIEFNYLHLIDNMTGNDVDLLANPNYSFDAQSTDYASRFRLVFATGSSAGSDSFGFINGMGNLCIFGIEGEATLQVMDALGRIISSDQFSGSYEQKLNVAPGVYMIRLINGNDVKVQKVVIR